MKRTSGQQFADASAHPSMLSRLVGVVMGAALGAAVGVLALYPDFFFEALVATFLFGAVTLVMAARDKRRAGIWLIAALLPGVIATGVRVVGPVELSQVVPVGIVAVTFLPGVARSISSRPHHRWAVLVASGLVLGGWLATLAGNGDPEPMVAVTMTTLPMVLTVHRLAPDWEELSILLVVLVVAILVSTIIGVTELRSPSGRSLGFTHHSNQFGMQAVIAAPLLWLLWKRGRIPTPFALAGFAVLLSGVAQSGSRSGFIAAVVVLVLWLIRRFGGSGFLTIAVVAVSLVSLVGIPSLDTPTTDRLLDPALTENSNEARLETMSVGLERLRQDPLLGEGFPHSGPLPHNVLLLVWGFMGLLGLIAFLVLIVRVVRDAAVQPTSSEAWPLALALMGFLTATSLNNSVATPAAWMLVGCLALTEGRARERPTPVGRPVSSEPASS